MDKGLISRLQVWAKQPFSEQMDLVHWALFTVLIVSIVFLWCRVLGQITEI